MKVIRGLFSPEVGPAPRAVTDGAMDGVHLGHQALLRRTVEVAGQIGATPTLMTYEPLPAELLGRPGPRRRLTLLPEKLTLCERLGLAECIIAEFTDDFAALTPEQFLAGILRDHLHASAVVVGEGHTFGAGGRAGLGVLQEICGRLGMSVVAIPPLVLAGVRISSTLIRARLRAGRVACVRELLGRDYHAAGPVVAGAGRGRALGFPTANLQIPDLKLLPADGVYACRAVIAPEPLPDDGAPNLPAAVNIGRCPTFGQNRRTVEAHLADFDDDLTGKIVHLFFLDRIRDEQAFSTVGELARQVEQDVQAVREIVAQAST